MFQSLIFVRQNLKYKLSSLIICTIQLLLFWFKWWPHYKFIPDLTHYWWHTQHQCVLAIIAAFILLCSVINKNFIYNKHYNLLRSAMQIEAQSLSLMTSTRIFIHRWGRVMGRPRVKKLNVDFMCSNAFLWFFHNTGNSLSEIKIFDFWSMIWLFITIFDYMLIF